MAVIEKNLPSMDVAVTFTSSTFIIPYYYYYGLRLAFSSRERLLHTPLQLIAPISHQPFQSHMYIHTTDHNYGVLLCTSGKETSKWKLVKKILVSNRR